MQPTDVAIIGLACRFPAAANPAEFWRLIHDGLEVTRPPRDDHTGQQREGLLDNISGFDADFFNVSPRQACAMDPRQRLALELGWEVLEDAFIVPATLRDERVAVVVGAMTDDYAALTLRDATGNVDHHSFAGVSRTMIANRISYALGLRGTSMTIDSGQSSSLLAVHLACESLRTGESTLAIAGGFHLNLASETALLETAFGAISESGHTYAFDRRADGYVRGEGGGLVLLKPLRAALDDGDRIRAIIRGSAAGNAGHSAGGQTAPSVAGQADVIRRALASAGLTIDHVDYIEAHGTGTKIGDPAEVKALGEVLAGRRDRPVTLGSVKSNIGHTGAAAGIAGLLKVVLATENAVLPPSINYAEPVDGIDLDAMGLRVNTAAAPWPAGDGPRRAGVSSFGMGGTNAHVIVEQAPAGTPTEEAARESKDQRAQPHQAMTTVWVLSGRSDQALSDQAARLRDHVADHAELDVNDVGWSLATTRTPFEHRAVLVGADRRQFRKGLTGLASRRPGAGTVVGRVRPMGKTAFVFPGQGAQWPGMGAGLYERFPVFARAFDQAARALNEHLRVPLGEVMWGNAADALDGTEFAQPALFALEAALAALLADWGVVPDVVLGHSVGEITAAHVAGVLSLADAAKLVAARGRLMAGLPAGGAMVAVAAAEAEVVPMLSDGVSIAALNGPNAVVISGAESAVGAIAETFRQRGRRVHRLAVSHAFHSPLMEPMIEDFAAVAATVSVAEPRITLVDNISGRPAGAGYGSAQHWVDHVRAPVRFVDGVRAAESAGAGVFVEVGPGGGLSAAMEQSLTAQGSLAVVTMPKGQPEADSLLTAAGRLFADGGQVDWGAVLARGRRVRLPTYAFVRQRYWLDTAAHPVTQPAPEPADLAEHLRRADPDERRRRLVELVCAHVAAVLGHTDGHAVAPGRAFEDLGLDSLSGVELRNRLTTETGLALSRTLVFDYPTPAAVADHLAHQLLHEGADDPRIRSLLMQIPISELQRAGLLDKLLALGRDEEKPANDLAVSDDVIDSMSPEALIAMALDAEENNDAE